MWLTVPTYNEAGNVERIVRAALGQLERLRSRRASGAGRRRRLPGRHGRASPTALAAELPAVEVLHRARKQGLGRAYLAGFERALDGGAELVIVMDADFSHDPAHLPAMLAAARDSDLVLGSRYVHGGARSSTGRRCGGCSAGPARCTRARILGVKVRDLTGGFRCIRREVLEARRAARRCAPRATCSTSSSTFRALRAGFRVAEVPIVFRDRTVGESKISLSIAVEALWLVPSLRFPSLRRARPVRKVPLARPAGGSRRSRSHAEEAPIEGASPRCPPPPRPPGPGGDRAAQ